MIKLKDILNETIYGNQAVVYHRTNLSDLISRIYTSGFKPGDGAMYGKGMYACYDLASQERPEMSGRYGNIIAKFAVNLTGFMFFDWSEFVKTPLYKEKLKSSTSKTFIQDQIEFYKISMTEPLEDAVLITTTDTANIALYVYKNSNLSRKVAGLVYTDTENGNGKVLVCYDVKRLRPVAVKKDEDTEFTKINTTKDFLSKTANNTNYIKPGTATVKLKNNANGTIDALGDFGKADLTRYPKISPLIRLIVGDVDLTKASLTVLPDLSKSTVNGFFRCVFNELTSLEGSPKKVGGFFNCSHNKLTTLEGAPTEVGKDFCCNVNRLTTLKGAPEKVGGDFICVDSELKTLEGSPKKIVGSFNCADNQLTSLKGAPEEIGVDFICINNELTTLEGCPKMVAGDFIHSSSFKKEEILAVCNVKGQIIKR
jgi:hypothetical protein